MKKIPSTPKLKYAVYLNEHAFTLIEMLFTFSVFIIIVFLISPIFQVMQSSSPLQNRIQDMEWDVFCSQMKKEIRMSTKVQVTGNTLILTENSGTVIYERYENSLRRRVNYSGHEILLQNISEVNFTLQNSSVKTVIKDLTGKDYTIVAYSFLDWNVVQ